MTNKKIIFKFITVLQVIFYIGISLTIIFLRKSNKIINLLIDIFEDYKINLYKLLSEKVKSL